MRAMESKWDLFANQHNKLRTSTKQASNQLFYAWEQIYQAKSKDNTWARQGASPLLLCEAQAALRAFTGMIQPWLRDLGLISCSCKRQSNKLPEIRIFVLCFADLHLLELPRGLQSGENCQWGPPSALQYHRYYRSDEGVFSVFPFL